MSLQVHNKIINVLSDPSSGSISNPVDFSYSESEIGTESRKNITYTLFSQMVNDSSRIHIIVDNDNSASSGNSVYSNFGMISADTASKWFSIPFIENDKLEFRVIVKAGGDYLTTWKRKQ